MHVVPTVQKGGQSLPYLSLELCRFVMWTGHQAVCFRCDNEPSCLALLDAVKALKELGVHTTVELVVAVASVSDPLRLHHFHDAALGCGWVGWGV